MPGSSRPRRSFAIALVLLFTVAAAPAGAVQELPCNQTDNTALVCTGNPCTITQDFHATGGCTLDFGTRAVVFKGNFDVDGATLTVVAGEIRVEGTANVRAQGLNGQRGG